MNAVDRARAVAERGLRRGRAQMDEIRARREHRRLLRILGEAYHAEHSGEGPHEAVTGALAAVDAHQRVWAQVRAGSGRTGTGRRAREIMHAGAECVGMDDTVAAAAAKMRDLGIGSLPICGADDRLHGILTDRDIAVRCVAEGRDPAQVRVGELAQGRVFCVDATADIDQVLEKMERHQIKRLPVLENRRLVGIISEADLARHLDEHRVAEFVEKVYGR
ncbi:CBS domain-containing protein [Micromonospora sp. CPCC 206061]|uniref:CBS domain-containing protein n=1 Tax=Micromonospora sp. CPCC 206061 TaxID=3122410 RepID=UPI002FF16BAB